MTLIGPALIGPAILGSLLLAVLSTVADYVWFLGIPQHQVSSGSIHGALLFAALGGYLGWRKGKAVAGAIGGLVSGLLAALSFYALAPLGRLARCCSRCTCAQSRRGTSKVPGVPMGRCGSLEMPWANWQPRR